MLLRLSSEGVKFHCEIIRLKTAVHLFLLFQSVTGILSSKQAAAARSMQHEGYYPRFLVMSIQFASCPVVVIKLYLQLTAKRWTDAVCINATPALHLSRTRF